MASNIFALFSLYFSAYVRFTNSNTQIIIHIDFSIFMFCWKSLIFFYFWFTKQFAQKSCKAIKKSLIFAFYKHSWCCKLNVNALERHKKFIELRSRKLNCESTMKVSYFLLYHNTLTNPCMKCSNCTEISGIEKIINDLIEFQSSKQPFWIL